MTWGPFPSLNRAVCISSLLLGCLAVTNDAAAQNTILVAANGVDSLSCGSAGDPCRSIRQGIDNAVDGDSIVVGPGRYGDNNNNGIFGEDGEEEADLNGACDCLLRVDKSVRIVSRDGAAATVLHAGWLPMQIVRIYSSYTTFGEPGHGFTLTGSTASAISGLSTGPETGFNIIAGNIVSNNSGNGVRIFGGQQTVAANVFTTNGAAGFQSGGGQEASGLQLLNNVAVGNTTGFDVSTPYATVRGNRASDNRGSGFLVTKEGAVVEGNVAVSNKATGIVIDRDAGLAPAVVRYNNIYDNSFEPAFNCGVTNLSTVTIDATQNFWGAASGPGANPADDGGPGSGCSGQDRVIVTPFATEEFVIPE